MYYVISLFFPCKAHKLRVNQLIRITNMAPNSNIFKHCWLEPRNLQQSGYCWVQMNHHLLGLENIGSFDFMLFLHIQTISHVYHWKIMETLQNYIFLQKISSPICAARLTPLLPFWRSVTSRLRVARPATDASDAYCFSSPTGEGPSY